MSSREKVCGIHSLREIFDHKAPRAVGSGSSSRPHHPHVDPNERFARSLLRDHPFDPPLPDNLTGNRQQYNNQTYAVPERYLMSVAIDDRVAVSVVNRIRYRVGDSKRGRVGAGRVIPTSRKKISVSPQSKRVSSKTAEKRPDLRGEACWSGCVRSGCDSRNQVDTRS